MTAVPEAAPAAGVGRWSVLSCYTAALAAYHDDGWPESDVAGRIARSVRLAVRFDDGALRFSHHHDPLHRLPTGGTLEHAGDDRRSSALDGIAAELELSGRVLVVTHSALLPWSVADQAADAPHLLLLDGRRPGPGWGEWHAVDHFAGVLASGAEQPPFEGYLSTDDLVRALSGGRPFTEDQERRTAMMTGFPLPTVRTSHRWLRRTPEPVGDVHLAGTWLHGPRHVWSRLGPVLRQPERAAAILDDVWAASQHHLHRIAHVRRQLPEVPADLARAAEKAWSELPQKLRIADASARRGRDRSGTVDTAVDDVARAEHALTRVLNGSAWTEIAA